MVVPHKSLFYFVFSCFRRHLIMFVVCVIFRRLVTSGISVLSDLDDNIFDVELQPYKF